MPKLWLADRLSEIAPAHGRLSERAALAARSELEYIVVDEIEEAVATVICEPWPALDDRGRLRFGGEESRVRAEVDVDELQRTLRRRRPVRGAADPEDAALRERALRVGDVFCARVKRDLLALAPGDPASWLLDPIIDVTAAARQQAKAQYFAAVGPVLRQREVEVMAEEFFAGEQPADGR